MRQIRTGIDVASHLFTSIHIYAHLRTLHMCADTFCFTMQPPKSVEGNHLYANKKAHLNGGHLYVLTQMCN